ncbi:hypothetical protein ACOBWA_05745 [Psychrobacter sp. ER1]|uniref:hypothetical protein n=1 Tax=Psychrobacter sp. ER1 TaxID=3406645 RepID=UPI003B42FCFE
MRQLHPRKNWIVAINHFKLYGCVKKAGLVTSERHGQWTFYQRHEANIEAFLNEVEKELLKL